ncbi:NADH dehydrogenase [Raphidocelis subcapitata]|uniref:NADH dehydrogenase [ubiquinone] 1 alpha subcomplex subunit 12 n=1 Tax=Raphidocelis subcapitata TaxID=307507 RepID=A0A2V0NS92_9CHLO|nr:NADH dehydrogenase [Raphidocelis subcapitata]|eukprot:GBF90494.1 NADH dehydrogenase [Raphidocelis subcapitata]
MAKQWLNKVLELGEVKGGLAWGRFLFDGNRWVTLMEQAPKGKLVGTDYHGNRYFENEGDIYTRKRFVIYAEKRTNAYNPTSVPPEWHAWLNYINDYEPTTFDYKPPVYALKAEVTATGTPKGAWADPDKRNWLKYSAWAPPSSGARGGKA